MSAPTDTAAKNHVRRWATAGFQAAVIPIKAAAKEPAISRWGQHVATDAEITAWDAAGMGVGIRSSQFPAVDLDVNDQAIAHRLLTALEQRFGQPLCHRIGRAPRLLIPFRLADDASPFSKMSLTFNDSFDNQHGVEILGHGQQWVADGTHPVTQKPYSWPTGHPCASGAGALPQISADLASDILNEIKDLLVREFAVRVVARQGTAATTTLTSAKADYAPSPQHAYRALWYLPNQAGGPYDSRQEWIRVCHAYKGALGPSANDDASRETWVVWSEQWPNSRPGEAGRTYDSIRSPHSGWLTLERLAMRHGLPTPFPVLPSASQARGSQGRQWTVPTVIALDPPPAPLPYLLEGFIPQGMLVVLAGRAGLGKTYLAKEIGAHGASGKDFGGRQVLQGGFLALFGEEDGAQIHRRAKAIEQHMSLPMSGWSDCGWFSADDEDDGPILFIGDAQGHLKATPLWEWFEAEVLAKRPALVIIDNANAVLAAPQNAYETVNLFLNHLQTLTKRSGATVLLLHHPNKSEEAVTAGSQAYVNKPRVVLQLRPPKDDESGQGSPDRLVLEVVKSNVGGVGSTMELKRIQDGVLVPIPPPPQASPAWKKYQQQCAVLQGLAELTQQGRYAGPTHNSSMWGPKILRETLSVKMERMTQKEVHKTLTDLLNDRIIVVGSVKRPNGKRAAAYEPTGKQPTAPPP